jgi:hypothetical protein
MSSDASFDAVPPELRGLDLVAICEEARTARERRLAEEAATAAVAKREVSEEATRALAAELAAAVYWRERIVAAARAGNSAGNFVVADDPDKVIDLDELGRLFQPAWADFCASLGGRCAFIRMVDSAKRVPVVHLTYDFTR